MIAIPGDTPATTISGIIADEAAIGMVNQKTTAVRIIPVVGKKVGDTVEFGGLVGLCSRDAGQPFQLRVHFVNRDRSYSGSDTQFQELTGFRTLTDLNPSFVSVTVVFAVDLP